MQYHAIYALGGIGDRIAIFDLLQALRQPDDIKKKIAAATALGKIGDTTTIEPLLQATSGFPTGKIPINLHRSVVAALVNIGSEAVPILLQALSNPDWGVILFQERGDMLK